MADITLTKANLADLTFWQALNIRPGSRAVLSRLSDTSKIHLNSASITIADAGSIHCFTDADLGGGSFANLRIDAGHGPGAKVSETIPVTDARPISGPANCGTIALPHVTAFGRPESARIACFARGTMIETDAGPRRIETLVAGDRVRTLDHGMQPVQAVGQRLVPGIGSFAPIVFDAGCIGNTRRLVLSPYHRVILSGWQAELHFGTPEVLVQALFMVNGTSIRQSHLGVISYHHLLMERHEILFSDGALTESFNPCLPTDADDRDATALRAELQALMPGLAGHLARGAPQFQTSARRILRRFEATSLLN